MRQQKSSFTLKAVLFVAVMVIGLVLTIGAGAEGEGVWELDPTEVCPSSTVCAEWDVGGANMGSCCIPGSSLGTGNLMACGGALSQGCQGTF